MTERTAKILDFSVTRTNTRHRSGQCPHRRVTVDENGGTVECDDCGKPIDPVWFIGLLARDWERIGRELERQRGEAAHYAAQAVHMKAAKAIESAWRGPRRMAVNCPHCRRGILPQDMANPSRQSEEMELARRRKQEESKR